MYRSNLFVTEAESRFDNIYRTTWWKTFTKMRYNLHMYDIHRNNIRLRHKQVPWTDFHVDHGNGLGCVKIDSKIWL